MEAQNKPSIELVKQDKVDSNGSSGPKDDTQQDDNGVVGVENPTYDATTED